jgi:hypothetical protein
MKKYATFGWLFAVLALLLSSCQVIGDIFKAGVWVGILMVVIVIVIIIFIVAKIRK